VGCCHGYDFADGGERAFSVDASAITFGPGVLDEAGALLRARGCKRVALFTDRTLASLPPVAAVRASLRAAAIDVVLYDGTQIEPTDASLLTGAAFARQGAFDGYVSVGGGSVIDTCKASALYATYPADFLTYVNAPMGEARPVPGPLPPHIACPTTCGTGSECTGIAVFDYLALQAKTGIASPRLRPAHALIDPTCTHSLPPMVVAASGFDVLCHALESFTARPYTARAKPAASSARPMSQGRNPWSDLGSARALDLAGKHLARAVADSSDHEAREALAWAATLAGLAFGNAGVHLPHAMSYAVAGLVRAFRCPGYPDEPLVPHGLSVIVSAPSVFRSTGITSPDRHLEAAAALGADVRGASRADAGVVLAEAIVALMHETGVPNGIEGVGYSASDIPALARGAFAQKRLVANAPAEIEEEEMRALFKGALSYW
jgi:hydroxyacid-oxoacid transhydrogenase